MFKDRLKECRKKVGLSQAALAERLFVSQQAVAKWETDRATPNPEMLAKLAKELNVSVDYLTGNAPLLGRDGLSERDRKDIAKDMESIRDGPASFNGENIDDDDAELLLDAIEMMLKRVKKINKVKYNPNKNKSEG